MKKNSFNQLQMLASIKIDEAVLAATESQQVELTSTEQHELDKAVIAVAVVIGHIQKRLNEKPEIIH